MEYLPTEMSSEEAVMQYDPPMLTAQPVEWADVRNRLGPR